MGHKPTILHLTGATAQPRMRRWYRGREQCCCTAINDGSFREAVFALSLKRRMSGDGILQEQQIESSPGWNRLGNTESTENEVGKSKNRRNREGTGS